mgnify:CR=1 FL=1
MPAIDQLISLSCRLIGRLAEFTEALHVERNLMRELYRVFTFRLLELDIVAADRMFPRRITFLCLGGDREPGAFPVLVTIDGHPLPGHARRRLTFANRDVLTLGIAAVFFWIVLYRPAARSSG